MECDAAELETIIRSLLVSTTSVLDARALEVDYRNNEGKCFPFRELGFTSFVQYLKSIPHVVELHPYDSPNPVVSPIITSKVKHIDSLVCKQKTAPKIKRHRGSHYGRYGSVPPRRPPSFNWHRPRFQSGYGSAPWRGVRDSYDDNGYRSHETKEHHDTPKYPDEPSTTEYNTNGYKVIPAGMEEEICKAQESDDYDDYDIDNYIDKMQFDDEFEKIDEETVSNYTIRRCTKSLLKAQEKQAAAVDSATRSEDQKSPRDMWDHEHEFSATMIEYFRKILLKHPDGIWATELPKIYFDEFKVSLDIQQLGYPSVVNMAVCLPTVFRVERATTYDWKLYDARLPMQKKGKTDEERNDYSAAPEKTFVPNFIIEEVTKLVERQPAAVKSTDLVYLFEKEYYKKLDLDALGFKRIEDFLDILKKSLTVKKSGDHYVLLSKHKTLILNSVKQEDILPIPKNCLESFRPDCVLKPGDVIPNQDLPPLKMDADDEPVLEIEVRVLEVMSPGMFYIMLNSKFNDLQNMMEDLDKFYRTEEKSYKISFSHLAMHMYCVCMYEDSWHRAKITGFHKNAIEIEYIDYGTPGKVDVFQLRWLHVDFATLPVQAFAAKLLGISPVDGGTKWPTSVCKEFLKVVSDVRLLAYVYQIGIKREKKAVERIQLEIILFDTDRPKEVIINEYLVEKGLAVFSSTKKKYEEVLQPTQPDPLATLQPPPQVLPTESRQAPRVPPGFENVPLSGTHPSQQFQNFDYHKYASQQENTSPISQFVQSFNTVMLNGPQQSAYFNPYNTLIVPPAQIRPPYLFPHTLPSYYPPSPFYSVASDMGMDMLQSSFLQAAIRPPLLNYAQMPTPTPTISSVKPEDTKITREKESSPLHPDQPVTCLNQPNTFTNQPDTCINPTCISQSKTSTNLPNTSINQFKTTNQPTTYINQPDTSTNRPTTCINQPDTSTNQPNTCINQPDTSTNRPTTCINQPDTSTNQPNTCINQFKTTNQPTTFINQPDTSTNQPNTCINHPMTSYNQPMTSPKLLETCTDQPKIANTPADSQLAQSALVEATADKLQSEKEQTSDEDTEAVIQSSKERTRLGSSGEDYFSAEELVETTLVTNFQATTLNDSWDDLDLDDTPAKADNFTEDLSEVLESEETLNYLQSHQSPVDSVSLTNNLNTEQILIHKNWKEIFDADKLNITERSKTDKPETPAKLSNNLKIKQVEKLEFRDKFFHVIWVNNKRAVITQEFYPLFIHNVNYITLLKLVEVKFKAFSKIWRRELPELFAELDKIQFHCGAKKTLSLGIPISYLDEIPRVFSVLNHIPDPELLRRLEIETSTKREV